MKSFIEINKPVLLYLFLPALVSFGTLPINRAGTGHKKVSLQPAVKTPVTKWNADPSKARITFKVGGPFGTVDGSLSGLQSTILFDKNNLSASAIRASVSVKTISTGIGLRNRDIQKEKYLDSDNHPLMSFDSKNIQQTPTGYTAIGNLTIKDVTRSVAIPFTFTENGNTGVFKGGFAIQRQDYHIGKAGGSIGNTVTISLEVPVTK